MARGGAEDAEEVVVISSSSSAPSATSGSEAEAVESGAAEVAHDVVVDIFGDHLVLVASSNGKGRRREEHRFTIARAGVVLGRGKLLPDRAASDKKLTVPDPEISRKHLRIWFEAKANDDQDDDGKARSSADAAHSSSSSPSAALPPGWRAEDLGSLNGSLRNGREFSSKDPPQPVRLGDKLGIGAWTFKVEACPCAECGGASDQEAPLSPAQAPQLARCLSCAADLSEMTLAAQNDHMQTCMAANQMAETRATSNAQTTARKRRTPSGGRAPREKKSPAPATRSTSSAATAKSGTLSRISQRRPLAAHKHVKPLLLSGSIPSSMDDVNRRLDLVDARIRELQAYRSKLADYLSDAQALQDALQDSGSDTAAETGPEGSHSGAATLVAALSRPLPDLVLSPTSSSSSGSPSLLRRPETATLAGSASDIRSSNSDAAAAGAPGSDAADADTSDSALTLGLSKARKASKSRVSLVILDDDDSSSNDEDDDENADNANIAESKIDEDQSAALTRKSLWAVTESCASAADGASPTHFRTSLLAAVAARQPEPGQSQSTAAKTARGAAPPALAGIPDADLQRALAEAGVSGAASRQDMENEMRQILERANNASNASAATDTTVSQVSLEGLTGAAREQALNLAICQAISQTMRNERLYENMLMNKCVHLPAVQDALKQSGVTIARARLATFLDHHGVIFKQ